MNVSDLVKVEESVGAETVGKDTIWIVKLLELTNLAKTRSEARRFIEQGAVKCDGVKIKDVNEEISLVGEHVLQVGKRGFRRVGKN